jgi:hypothetical protein
MEPASPEAVVDYLRDQIHRSGDVIPGWPKNVRSIAPNGVLFLGIDEKNQLYWDGKPIEIQRRLKFSRLQIIGAVLVGLATLIGGVGTGVNEGFDFGCKVHWWTQACPR